MRKHKKLVIFASMLIIVIASGTTGFFIAQSEPRIVEEKEPLAVDADNARIDREAIVLWHIDYKMCGHSITVENNVDENMIGLSFSQFCNKYPNLKVVDFSAHKIEIKTSFYCYCPEHYILKKCDDMLAIYRTAPGTDNQEIYIKTQICFDDIDSGEKEVLTMGRVFGSLEDIDSYIVNILE